MRQLVADPLLGPVVEAVGCRDLEVVPGLGRAAPHLAGEAPRVRGVDRVRLSGGASPITASQRTGTRLLDDGPSPAGAPRPRSATPSQPTTTWPSTRRRLSARPSGRGPRTASSRSRRRHRASRSARPRRPATSGSHSRADQLVLGVDVVRPAAGERAVVEHDPLVRRAELAAVVLDVELRRRPSAMPSSVSSWTVRYSMSPALGGPPQLRLAVALQEDERDPLALQQVPEDEAGRAGPDDDDRCRVDPHRPDLRAVRTPTSSRAAPSGSRADWGDGPPSTHQPGHRRGDHRRAVRAEPSTR